MTEDAELIRRYARDRSEAAFAELVQRHAGLVYSAALRQVEGDTLLAQDVTQSVFIDLARKGTRVADRPVLASWLYTSTRFAALKAMRAKRRRQIREKEAQFMEEIERGAASRAEWDQVRPLLDQEICDLNEADRSAILMRYFEGMPFAAMGTKLGIGESSARMRSERALEKLRLGLAKKGITSTAAALGMVIAAQAVAAPPVGLTVALTGSALAQAAAVGGSAGIVVKLSQFLAINKLKSGILAALTVGTASFASYESADERARSTAFLIYFVCFGAGMLFALLSVIFGHLGHAHVDAGHDGGSGGHTEIGSLGSDMPEFAPVGPTTIATFVTAFGGLGMVLARSETLHRFSGVLAALGALAIASVVGWGFTMVFRWSQSSSEGRVADVIGLSATVITPIALDSVGEIAYVQGGTRYSAPARAEGGAHFHTGSTVKITRVVGSQFYVAAS